MVDNKKMGNKKEGNKKVGIKKVVNKKVGNKKVGNKKVGNKKVGNKMQVNKTQEANKILVINLHKINHKNNLHHKIKRSLKEDNKISLKKPRRNKNLARKRRINHIHQFLITRLKMRIKIRKRTRKN